MPLTVAQILELSSKGVSAEMIEELNAATAPAPAAPQPAPAGTEQPEPIDTSAGAILASMIYTD